jgi:hypothetical protein
MRDVYGSTKVMCRFYSKVILFPYEREFFMNVPDREIHLQFDHFVGEKRRKMSAIRCQNQKP